MKNILLTILFIMIANVNYGQANSKDTNLDFVIVVDNDLGMGSIARQALELRFNNDSVQKIPFYYHPGNLSISKSDYETIMSDKVKEVRLLFNYLRYDGGKRYTRDYEIDIDKWWFGDLYNVIRIYNLDKGPYKGVFAPISKEKPYTFEHFSPMYTFTRVRHK